MTAAVCRLHHHQPHRSLRGGSIYTHLLDSEREKQKIALSIPAFEWLIRFLNITNSGGCAKHTRRDDKNACGKKNKTSTKAQHGCTGGSTRGCT